jgi:pyroglutamyl-peptidase
MTIDPVIITGFEPYGHRSFNPAFEVVRALDGCTIEGAQVLARTLPVSFARLRNELTSLFADNHASAVICLGLWPGENMIRLERVAINIADCEISDNDGRLLSDEPLSRATALARFTTLPIRAIEQRLLEAGIPTRVSNTAGTFLCNACLYTVLELLSEQRRRIPAGFIHLPYTPEQVASLIQDVRIGRNLEVQQRADLGSMSLDYMIRAVELAISTTVQHQASVTAQYAIPSNSAAE